MSKKREYTVHINGGAKRGASRYQYSYSNTKGIKLDLGPRSATIRMSLASTKSASEFGATGCRLYDDSLYKTSMAWLLRYGRIVPIQSVTVGVDDSPETIVYDAEKPKRGTLPFSAIDFSGKVDLPGEFTSEQVMSTILSVPRTKADHRLASLNALLLAKMKNGRSSASDIVDRFSNSWTALNGYYSYVDSRAPQTHYKEKKKMRTSLQLHGMGDCDVALTDGAQLERAAIGALKGVGGISDLDTPAMKERLALLSDRIRTFTNDKGKCPYESLTADGFLLFFLPYYFRCKLLHGEKPLPLFVYETDERVWCPPILSDLIVAFLDKNLWKLFDSDELEAIDQKLWGL